MGKRIAGKNGWALLLLILVGVVLGGFLGQLAAGNTAFRWLNYGQHFGLTTPVVLDLGSFVLTLGFSINITIASLIGVAFACIIYHFI